MQKRTFRGGRRSAHAPHSYQRGERRPTHVPHSYQPDKGKNIVVDENGFQPVKNMKNPKRNIFNIVNNEMRSSATALADEIRAARNRSNLQGVNTNRNQGEQRAASPTSPKIKEEPDRSKNHTYERGGKHTDLRLANHEQVVQTSKAVTASTVEELIEDIATPVEGRGDPASTMLWSPRKVAGHKWPLDREETETTEGEEDSDTEEAAVEASPDRPDEGKEASMYDVGDHMQIDARGESEGKSPPNNYSRTQQKKRSSL